MTASDRPLPARERTRAPRAGCSSRGSGKIAMRESAEPSGPRIDEARGELRALTLGK